MQQLGKFVTTRHCVVAWQSKGDDPVLLHAATYSMLALVLLHISMHATQQPVAGVPA